MGVTRRCSVGLCGKASQLLIEAVDDRQEPFVLFKPRSGPASVALGENRFRGLYVAGCDNAAEKLGAERNGPIPSPRRRYEEEAELADQTGGSWVAISGIEHIAALSSS